jgi:hypothetical protein
MPRDLQVEVKPFGPEPAALAELPDLVLAHPLLRK